jgi:hypothetical protein
LAHHLKPLSGSLCTGKGFFLAAPETSAGLALKLISSGFTKVYALKGGWKEWSG